jgi:ubiquinol-cytochrome c reductase cytochrome c1 subunit
MSALKNSAFLGALFTLMFLPMSVMASGGHVAMLDKAQIDLGDTASLQRGAQLFVDRCLSCHSANFMRYNRVGQDLGMTDAEVKQRLIKGANIKVGSTMQSTMPAALAKNAFGVVPPDLSLIARSRGSNWLYTYLRSFYVDPARPLGVNNLLFKDVGMPGVFWREQGEQTLSKDAHGAEVLAQLKPGTMKPAEFDGMIGDLVGFMTYMAEPAQLQRKGLGFWVLGFLAVLFVLFLLLKQEYWRDIKH